MESTEARSDFISLYLELCPEAIVAYSTKTFVLSSISGGGKKIQTKLKSYNLTTTTYPFTLPPLELQVQVSIIRTVYQTCVVQCLSTQRVYTLLLVHPKSTI